MTSHLANVSMAIHKFTSIRRLAILEQKKKVMSNEKLLWKSTFLVFNPYFTKPFGTHTFYKRGGGGGAIYFIYAIYAIYLFLPRLLSQKIL